MSNHPNHALPYHLKNILLVLLNSKILNDFINSNFIPLPQPSVFDMLARALNLGDLFIVCKRRILATLISVANKVRYENSTTLLTVIYPQPFNVVLVVYIYLWFNNITIAIYLKIYLLKNAHASFIWHTLIHLTISWLYHKCLCILLLNIKRHRVIWCIKCTTPIHLVEYLSVISKWNQNCKIFI